MTLGLRGTLPSCTSLPAQCNGQCVQGGLREQGACGRRSCPFSSHPNIHPLHASWCNSATCECTGHRGILCAPFLHIPGTLAGATISCTHICASYAITWASQYIDNPHLHHPSHVMALCSSPQWLLSAAGVPQASCENLPQLLACVTQPHL